jgi:cytoskeletal protein CcmA (bactofilin family)
MFTRNTSDGIEQRPTVGHPPADPAARPFAVTMPPPFPAAEAKEGTPDSSRMAVDDGYVTIGRGARITGKIQDCRRLEVLGVLEADVVAETIVVRAGGGIRGTIETDNAEIHGVIEGTLLVHDHIDVRETGEVTGELSYRTIAIATGARLLGSLRCHEVAGTEAERPSADVVPFNAAENSSTRHPNVSQHVYGIGASTGDAQS